MTQSKYWNNKDSILEFKNKKKVNFFKSEKFFLNKIKSDLNTILDVGCASGRFIELLKDYKSNFNYLGIDIIEKQILIAKQTYENEKFNFLLTDFESFKINQKFSLVNSTGVIQHTDRFKDFIYKMIKLSSNYVLFDIKISQIDKDYLNINDSYIEVNNNKLPYIIFSKKYFLQLISNSKNLDSIYLYGYLTQPNKNVTILSKIKKIYSVGVLIKKSNNKTNNRSKIKIYENFKD